MAYNMFKFGFNKECYDDDTITKQQARSWLGVDFVGFFGKLNWGTRVGFDQDYLYLFTTFDK